MTEVVWEGVDGGPVWTKHGWQPTVPYTPQPPLADCGKHEAWDRCSDRPDVHSWAWDLWDQHMLIQTSNLLMRWYLGG